MQENNKLNQRKHKHNKFENNSQLLQNNNDTVFFEPTLQAKQHARKILTNKIISLGNDVNSSVKTMAIVLLKSIYENKNLYLLKNILQLVLSSSMDILIFQNWSLKNPQSLDNRKQILTQFLNKLEKDDKNQNCIQNLINQSPIILQIFTAFLRQILYKVKIQGAINFQYKIPTDVHYKALLQFFDINYRLTNNIYMLIDEDLFISTHDDQQFVYGRYFMNQQQLKKNSGLSLDTLEYLNQLANKNKTNQSKQKQKIRFMDESLSSNNSQDTPVFKLNTIQQITTPSFPTYQEFKFKFVKHVSEGQQIKTQDIENQKNLEKSPHNQLQTCQQFKKDKKIVENKIKNKNDTINQSVSESIPESPIIVHENDRTSNTIEMLNRFIEGQQSESESQQKYQKQLSKLQKHDKQKNENNIGQMKQVREPKPQIIIQKSSSKWFNLNKEINQKKLEQLKLFLNKHKLQKETIKKQQSISCQDTQHNQYQLLHCRCRTIRRQKNKLVFNTLQQKYNPFVQKYPQIQKIILKNQQIGLNKIFKSEELFLNHKEPVFTNKYSLEDKKSQTTKTNQQFYKIFQKNSQIMSRRQLYLDKPIFKLSQIYRIKKQNKGSINNQKNQRINLINDQQQTRKQTTTRFISPSLFKSNNEKDLKQFLSVKKKNNKHFQKESEKQIKTSTPLIKSMKFNTYQKINRQISQLNS